MSPKVTAISDYFASLYKRRADRQERREKFETLLPKDFSGQIFLKCREEGERIRERLAWLEGQLARVNAELKAAQLEVKNACLHCWLPGKFKGDILGEFSIGDPVPDPHRFQRGPKALALQQKRVNPLLQRKKLIEREIYAREQELGELRKMANRAGAGDVTLIHFLSDHWRSRLEVGAALLGKLPPAARMIGNVINVDPGGHILPAAAVDEHGKPDLPPKAPGWRHIEPDLPGTPKTTDDFVRPE